NSRGRRVIPFDHFINNDLEYLSGGVSSQKYETSVTKTKTADYGHIKWIKDLVPNRMWCQVPVSYDKHALWGISHWGEKRQQFYRFVANRGSARDVYSKCRIIAVTKLEIVDWHNYKHLDWITVCRDDDKLYKFKEYNFNRLHIQNIEDMLLFLVQGKLINLTVEERLAFNVSLIIFTRSVVIQRRVEDLQLGVESYQKKLNVTKPDTDGTLNDVQTALNNRLKGIRMEYLPQTIWRHSDKDKAGAMIQAIDKQLKTRRIMRSLEKFVDGRPFDTPAGNPVKKILLKLNLSYHRILKDGRGDSDPEEDPEEDPIDYPADRGDDDDDDDESFDDDDEDDDDDVEEDEDEDEEEEEDHPASVDSVPPLIHRATARTSIRDEPPTPFWSEAEIARILAIPSPPPSPLSP
ncbi:hypothetical protein Tco_0365504, partial [Tanacetum coccineum]